MKLVQEEHMPVCQDAPHRNLAEAVVLQRFTVPFEFAVYFTCGLLSDPSNRTLLQAMSRREPNKRHHFVVVIDAGVAQAHPGLADAFHRYAARHRDTLELVGAPRLVAGGEQSKNNPAVLVELQESALEAALTAELSEDDPSFSYRLLGERLQRIKERKDAIDEATAKRLRELTEIAAEVAKTKQEPERLNLKKPGEYGLFSVLREFAREKDETYIAACACKMVAYLSSKELLSPGWSNSKDERMRVERSILAESWKSDYAALGVDPGAEPAFLQPAGC